MPQGKKKGSNGTDSPAKAREALHKAIMEAYDGEDTAHKLFRMAVSLDQEKREVYTRVAANRSSLRDLALQGIVNAEDVDALYPRKSSDTEAEAEAPAAA